MRVERRTPVAVQPPDEIVVVMTPREAKAIREALYIAYLARDIEHPGSDPLLPPDEIEAIGNELYKRLTGFTS